MGKKWNQKEIEILLSEKYPDQKFDFTGYINTSSKVQAIDPKYGVWYPTVRNLIQKTLVCRERYEDSIRVPKIGIEEVKNKLESLYDTTITIDESTYKGISKRCRFVDSTYGEFFTTPYHVFGGHCHKVRGIIKFSKSNQLDIEEIEVRVRKVHGNTITIDRETYNGMYHKAKFIHSIYGEWWATPSNIIKGASHPSGTKDRILETNMTRYGVPYAIQNEEIYKRTSRSRWRTIVLKHWYTGEDILCRGSLEYAIVNYLNNNSINYYWQIRFELPGNVVYFIDLYLVDETKYIEIKGYFLNSKNKMKWETFHEKCANSEIWFTNNVTSIIGKSSYMMQKEFNKDYEEIRRCVG